MAIDNARTERDALDELTDYGIEGSFETGKIYCANCIHCKLVPSPSDNTGQFMLRVKCAAGKWKKKLGGEKQYKYFTVTRRSIDCCDMYEPMGEAEEFISDLRKTLPIRDEIYE
jgi:hypothetical protein